MGDFTSMPSGRMAVPEGITIDGTDIMPSKDFS
jgi:hypothetical protein